MSTEEELEAKFQEDKAEIQKLLETNKVCKRALGAMIMAGHIFAWCYQIILRTLKEHTSDERSEHLANMMRQMAEAAIEQGYNPRKAISELQKETLPFLTAQYRFEEAVRAAKQEQIRPMEQEELPVQIASLKLIRGEVTLLYGPRKLLKSLFRDAAEDIRNGIKGVDRYSVCTNDTVGFRRVELFKAWGMGTSRSKIDALLKDRDLLLVTEGLLLLDPKASKQKNFLEWLRMCKLAAGNNNAAVLVAMPQTDLEGLDELDTSDVSEHHTVYKMEVRDRGDGGVAVAIMPGNKEFVLREVH